MGRMDFSRLLYASPMEKTMGKTIAVAISVRGNSAIILKYRQKKVESADNMVIINVLILMMRNNENIRFKNLHTPLLYSKF